MAPKNTNAASKKPGSSKEPARSEGPGPQDHETESKVLLEDATPEVEQLQEAMWAFQEEMAQFNARQESFAKEMARQKAAFELQRWDMDARSEVIRRRQEEADRRHREAALALEAATHFTQVNAQTAA